MAKVNFLLGKAERLVRKIPAPKMKPDKAHPYAFDVAKKRVVSKLEVTAAELLTLPSGACPNDEAVALITLHPAYLAKSYFPDRLLDEAGLRAVGSRQRIVSPDAWAIQNPPDHALTAELFVAGPRKQFDQLAKSAARWTEDSRAATDLRKIEDVRAYSITERLRTTRTQLEAPFWEIILHASAQEDSDFILDGFRKYLKTLDIDVDLDKRLHAQGLCFMPVRAPRKLITEVAAFSFLRAVREMPRMRPVVRLSKSGPSFKCQLPDHDVLDPTIRVVALDGGMPSTPDLTRWSTRFKATGIGKAVPALIEHGLGVTSALLFGPLEQGETLPRPFARVEHYRVFDEANVDDDSCEYFDAIKRIMSILESGRYDFANLSSGPDLPIEDDNIHTWTAMLDQYLKNGMLLMTIAAGNGGERDGELGDSRIQSPADCVNGMAIGSADCDGPKWKRSSHSCIGPGRSPGVVKPDLLSFGGCPKKPFYVIGMNGHAEPRVGTSFASPNALRSAIGVRAYLGPVLSPLAIKALLIHRSDRSDAPREETGWGKIPADITSLITCEDGTAHIVYQGEMLPGSFQRAPIPVPEEQLEGKVEVIATLCFASETDPQDPIHYTRSGLEVRFRPHDEKKRNTKQQTANSRSFFNAKSLYAGEQELRSDSHKWETCPHARQTFFGKSLHDPAFDIHYNAREAGGKSRSSQNIAYALIVTVKAPRLKDLYDRIYRRYRTILEVLNPVIQIQIRT